MKKCLRLAGCVAFNYVENDDKDVCDMFGQMNSLEETNLVGTRGHFSDTCNEIKNLTDYRQKRSISLVFKKKTEKISEERRQELTS